MGELTIKSDHNRIPLTFASFYELYKRFLKEHGCKWHDISKLLTVVAEIIFDVDGACSLLASKVSVIKALCEYPLYTLRSLVIYVIINEYFYSFLVSIVEQSIFK